jgi:Ca2+-dependent lipid-binding protein
VSIGGERYKSTTCNQGGRNPVWGDVFTFQNSANDMMLKVEVWDRDTFTPDDLIGDGTINIMPFMNGMPSNRTEYIM